MAWGIRKVKKRAASCLSYRRATLQTAVKPFQGWPAHRTWKGRAWRTQMKLKRFHGHPLTYAYNWEGITWLIWGRGKGGRCKKEVRSITMGVWHGVSKRPQAACLWLPLAIHLSVWLKLTYRTLKPQYNDPFYNKIPAIKNLISSPSVVNSIVKAPAITKSLL
jgi:hypothetical protein